MEPLWVRRFDWMPADLDVICGLFGCGLRHRLHRYVNPASALGAELDASVHQREQRVVLAEADIAARMPLGAALARQDVAGYHAFAAEGLDPEALAVGIAAVARGAACFLMSHDRRPDCCPGLVA